MNVSGMEAIAQLAQHAHNGIQHHHQQYPPQTPDHGTPPDSSNNNKRKQDDGGQQGSSKRSRSRYISLACNECKRRKIKCNGQNPCQRCGNLNLDCVYAPNCCNGFKDTTEYKEMSAHIASLQDQVNMLYGNLADLRAHLGHAPAQQQQIQPAQSPQHAHQQQSTPIDPSLQSHTYANSFGAPQTSPGAQAMSPSHHRPRSTSHTAQQPTFRGPMSSDFSFGVAKSSLQTMGISAAMDEQGGDGNGSVGDVNADTSQPSLTNSPGRPNLNFQVLPHMHEDKDPIWKISREEAVRLCHMYDDEMGLMYPVLDINKVVAYANKLYTFLEAMQRAGLMQGGLPGADAIQDEDTNIFKMVIATALTTEASGRSELGKRMFECVQPAIDNMLLGRVGVKGIRLLTMTAMYEFHRDNESTSWRIIGLTARLLIELGLHRRETYEAMTDEAERSETNLLFWAVYVLDRRWSFGTGMPFALQDSDIDPLLPRPDDRSPYLTAMIKYCEIGGKVWRTVASVPSPVGGGDGAINTEEMSYLDYQVIQWHRNIPPSLRFEHPSQQDSRLSTPTAGPPPSRAGHRLRIILYLRANQMRILIYRPALHSATSIMQHREQAQTVVDVAKDSIRVLTHINQTTDLYRTQQALFNAFLTSALAVLFLAVSHTPALFAENVRVEFYMALDLVRGFSKGSFVGKRLWRTIRVLKEVAPKLGLAAIKPDYFDGDDDDNADQMHTDPLLSPAAAPPRARVGKGKSQDVDPSRSAAVAMAGLAGHNVDEIALFGGGGGNNNTGPSTSWSGPSGGNSSSPENMANDLTSLFEAAGGLQAIGQGMSQQQQQQQQHPQHQQTERVVAGTYPVKQPQQHHQQQNSASDMDGVQVEHGAAFNGMGGVAAGGEEGLTHILKDLF